MGAFTPRQRTEIYNEISTEILAFAPLVSTELGEVIDNIAFSVSDQIYEVYVEIQNSLALLKLDSTTGSELDAKASEYPDLAPRFQSTRGTGVVQVTDPTITKIQSTVGLGGSNSGDNFLNVVDASTFPAAGSVLVGVRGGAVFETFTYTSKVGNQLQSTTDTIDFDHGSGESVVVTTVGDRVFPGPYQGTTKATAQTPAKTFTSTSALTIYDGEAVGEMSVQADVVGPDGNTPSNTISAFVGTPPFVGAQINNGAAIQNALAKEKDADLRSRIRQEIQALSSANIDAVTSALLNANNNGQRVVFAQIIEDPDPTLPSIGYIDDGSGFVPSEATLDVGSGDSPIVLVDSALGGERRFRIPPQLRPIIASDAENITRIFSNLILQLNGTPLVQGDSAGQYRMHPDNGFIRLNTGLSPGDQLKITYAHYYTGLVQEANWQIYGREDDRANYRGIVGLGCWVQVRTPAVQFVTVQANVVLDGSRSLSDVVTDARQNILNYINNLGIGNTVVHNRIIALGFVRGVKDFTLNLPLGDVIIPDGTLAKSTVGNITIG
jgi:hypothetical protein